MRNDIKGNLSIHSNSKGNLLKTTYYDDNGILRFVKSGRLQLRDFPERWGIEPIIEVLCYKVGVLLGLNVAPQYLNSLTGFRLNKQFTTIVSDSPDFRNSSSLIYLQSLYVENNENIEFEKLCGNTNCGEDLINLLAFDLIIMNEDRHNSNVGFLVHDNGDLTLSPIYDNGYSLLYDDIKGMLRDFKAASRHCLCNAPLYQESFKAAERMFAKYSKIYTPTISLDVENDSVARAVYDVKSEYDSLLLEDAAGFNNTELDDIWWEKVTEFISWRIEYVRNLRDTVEE